jgi:hypothetical protein
MSLFQCFGFSDDEEQKGKDKPKKYGKIIEKLPLKKIRRSESLFSKCFIYKNPEEKPVTTATCSEDGRYIGFGYGPNIKILDVWSENIISIFQLNGDNTHCMHFSKDNVLYSGTVSGQVLRLTLDGKCDEIHKTRSFSFSYLLKVYGVSGISTSHDSKVLLFTTTDMKMFLVNLQTKELLADLLG